MKKQTSKSFGIIHLYITAHYNYTHCLIVYTAHISAEVEEFEDVKMESEDDLADSSAPHVFSWQKSKAQKYARQAAKEKWIKYTFILQHTQLFEPLLSALEEDTLQKLLRVEVLQEDTGGHLDVETEYELPPVSKGAPNRSSQCYTICFMPHCPRGLYNKLFHANWQSRYKLGRNILFNISHHVTLWGVHFKIFTKSVT